jgi:glycerophosphoryl diester phosphodiesterase
VEIIAHRGASADAPENTLASVRLGWEQGADAVEVDVYLTRDGRLAVIHDKTTKRTAGLDKPVAEQTLAELQSLDAGSWKDARWTGERIPVLEDVLATVPDGKRLVVEIKDAAATVGELKRVFEASGKRPEQMAIISFELDVCAEAKRALPDHPVYYLAEFEQDKATQVWSPTVAELIEQAHQARVDGLDLSFKGPVDAALVKEARAAGLDVLVWTVDKPEDARRMVEAGVSGLTTNRPGALRKELVSN